MKEENMVIIKKEDLKIIQNEMDAIIYENIEDLVKSFLQDYLTFNEEEQLLDLIKEIIFKGKDYVKEILERNDVYEFQLEEKSIYVHSTNDHFIEDFLRKWKEKDETVIVCNRCGFEVFPSESEEYEYQCFYHDEDLYEIETMKISRVDYEEYLSEMLGCPTTIASQLVDNYRNYVQENKDEIILDIVTFSSDMNQQRTQTM